MANKHQKFVSAVTVKVSVERLSVDLSDGRSISVPLDWYPRLSYGNSAERRNWQRAGAGRGIHWPDLDEDISVEGLLLGYASGESQESLQRWLEQRRQRRGKSKRKRTARR